MNDLILPIVMKWAGKICADVCMEWGKFHNVKGEAEIGFDIVSQTAELIVGQFKANGQKAWICEYGSGSRMKPLDLSKYKSSKYWNPYRNGTAITGRNAGEYTDLDGNKHYSTGSKQGQDLERIYKPAEPKEIIRSIVFDKTSWYWVNMISEIKSAIKGQVMLSVRGLKKEMVIRI